MGSRQDGQPDHIGVLVPSRSRDLFGGQTNAGVDDFHSGVSGSYRDLLSSIGMAVETGLSHEESGRATGHGANEGSNLSEATAAGVLSGRAAAVAT